MQFVYHEKAGEQQVEISGETYTHLFKSRRNRSKNYLHVRNLKDDTLYTYNILEIQRKTALLQLQSSKKEPKTKNFHFTLGWAVVDPKIIEKTLPMLNEMGVGTIAFVYSDFSQKNFKIDIERLQKIVINSCQQCGRSNLLEFQIFHSLKEYFLAYPQSYILDFGGLKLEHSSKLDSVLVGCEGGFSEAERESFDTTKIIGFSTPFILKSQSAVCALSAKILL